MKIVIIPFKYVNALTDINGETIYLSLRTSNVDDVIKDELCHIVSKSSYHDKAWSDAYALLFGHEPHGGSEYDKLLEMINVSEKIGANVGNITGIQNMLLDYHLLQAYRKFASRVLATDGSWEITNNRIRLQPTPKGSFPVIIRYLPSIDDFNLPAAKELCTRAIIAEAKIMLGHTRRKISVPGPDGSSISMDGDALVSEGKEELKEIVEKAISLGEPLGFIAR